MLNIRGISIHQGEISFLSEIQSIFFKTIYKSNIPFFKNLNLE